jgi:hypothetical protein
MIPIEIVNKILVYVSELNNDLIITQYYINKNKEYYMINFNSNLLWRIKSTLRMKKIYPIYHEHNGGFNNKDYRELYEFGIPHYENELRNMITEK